MVFIAILVLTSPFWIDWLLYHSRMSIPEGCTASPNAQIVDVSVDPVGNSKTRRLKTVVFFSDGTQYITFKSHDTPGFLSTHMVVDKEVLAEIFEDAVTAHDKLCSGTRSQPAYSVTPPAEPKAPAPSVESSQKFAEPKSESTEPSPTIADPSAPAPATPKLRYCKHCGSPIDPATRQCTGCDKQYFRPPVLPKLSPLVAAAVLVCILVTILAFNLNSKLNAAEAEVEELNAQIAELNIELAAQEDLADRYVRIASSYKSDLSNLQKNYDELRAENADLRSENATMRSEIAFYDWAAVIVSDNGSRKYHKYGCSHLDLSDGYWIFNVENAKYQGYKACSHCCG